VNCLEPKDGEDDRASVDGSKGVASGDDDDVLDAVLGWVVVAAKADDGAKSEAKGVKDLIGGIEPDCGEQKLVHLGGKHVGEPLRRSVQRDPPEEEDGQDKVGEEGREVNHLSRGGNAFAKDRIDDQPRDDETNEVPVLDANKILNAS